MSAVPDPVLKRCACGRTYTAAQWQRLGGRLVGAIFGEVLEYRQCTCGSHITVVLQEEPEECPPSGVRPR